MAVPAHREVEGGVRLLRRALPVIVMLLSSPARADDDPVVVRVGSAELRASEVARRLAAIPGFQLRSFGATPDEIRRRFVDTVLIPELSYANEADRLAPSRGPAVRRRIRGALRRALVETLEEEARRGTSEEEIRAYYDAHRDEYEKPERIRLWRILVDDESLARRILSDARGAGGPERWSRLAREHSLDSATKMRSGLLGFVFPDGRTEVPQLLVDPALYAAAAKVKDGELVPEPVKEGAHLAVVWRRGTLPKEQRSFATAHDSILDLLVRQRTERELTALRDELRKRELKDENPAAVESLSPGEPLPLPSGQGPTPPASGSASPVPEPGPRGLR